MLSFFLSFFNLHFKHGLLLVLFFHFSLPSGLLRALHPFQYIQSNSTYRRLFVWRRAHLFGGFPSMPSIYVRQESGARTGRTHTFCFCLFQKIHTHTRQIMKPRQIIDFSLVSLHPFPSVFPRLSARTELLAFCTRGLVSRRPGGPCQGSCSG